MKKTFSEYSVNRPYLKELPLFCFLIISAVVLAFGKGYSYAVKGGIELWAVAVLPSLFPYFFITAVLSSLSVTGKISERISPLTGKIFNVNGVVGYAFVISLMSGYPIGAKTVSELKSKGLVSDAESVRASALCSTSSPMFLVGTVGGLMFKNRLFGVALLLTHILSSFVTGFIFSFYNRKEKSDCSVVNFSSSDSVLYDGAYSSVISVLVVGGLITLFFLLTEILLSFGILTPFIGFFDIFLHDENLSCGLVLGLLECTRGVNCLSALGVSLKGFLSTAFLCGFGGLSVIIQSVAYLKKAKIKTAPFFFAKILNAVFSLIFGALLFSVFF